MKVSTTWLKNLVQNADLDQIIELLPSRTIGTKEVTPDFIELDMKGYNRADLLSMRGVAYEVAAITDSKVTFTEPNDSDYIWNKDNYPKLDIEVEDKAASSIYCVAKIEGLSTQKSQEDSDNTKRLINSGMRPVNNIADITNLVMLEYGQPLHAFDGDQVADQKLIVRKAKTGETLTTLDQKARELESVDIVIADSKKILGLAGVMGGKDSEITDKTHTVLLEAAIFDGKALRRTAQRLNLFSEAGKRFQHGLTAKRLLQALNRAIEMYQELGGRLTAITLYGDFSDKKEPITLSRAKLDSLIGLKISAEQVEDILEKLNFQIEKIEENWQITPPYYRLDVTIQEDVIEEIARLYGYEKIPVKSLEGVFPAKIDQTNFELTNKIKQTLKDLGLTEIQTYSFYSTNVSEALGFDETNKDILVKIANPISTETEYMRQNIWPNILEIINQNIRQGYGDLALFEVGKAFELDSKGAPVEQNRLSIALMNNSENPILELYQLTKKFFESIGWEVRFEPAKAPLDLFHPNRFVFIKKEGQILCGIAEIHLRVLNLLGIEKRVAVFEVNI